MPTFGLREVEDSFRRVASHLLRPVQAYVLGGGAMAKLGVKAATKDVDIAFRKAQDCDAFEAALAAVGAKRIPEGGRQARIGTRHLWETPDGMGWDLFLDNVVGFPLHAEDFDNATLWLVVEMLELRHLAGDLIFVMKAFTPRTRDIGDMNDLVTQGAANARRVADLARRRIEYDPTAPWIAHFYQGVVELGDERGVDVRWVGEFEDAATMSLLCSGVVSILAEAPQDEASLLRQTQNRSGELRAALARLHAAQRIEQVEGRWRIRNP